jgi:general secretion pathway protein G
LKSKSLFRVQRSSPGQRKFAVFEAGFTLIELMIVITIILILIGMAVPRYERIVQHSKEAVLKHNLGTLRDIIDQYTLDKQAAPQSVEDLAQAGYLREVPVDPIVRSRDWAPQFDSVVLTPEQTYTGIVNVHSQSTGIALDGTKYSDW